MVPEIVVYISKELEELDEIVWKKIYGHIHDHVLLHSHRGIVPDYFVIPYVAGPKGTITIRVSYSERDVCEALEGKPEDHNFELCRKISQAMEADGQLMELMGNMSVKLQISNQHGTWRIAGILGSVPFRIEDPR